MKNISHHGSSLTHHCRTSTAVHCPELTSSPHPPDHLHSPAAGRNLGSHLLRSDNSSSAVPISLAVPMSLFVCLALFFCDFVCLSPMNTHVYPPSTPSLSPSIHLFVSSLSRRLCLCLFVSLTVFFRFRLSDSHKYERISSSYSISISFHLFSSTSLFHLSPGAYVFVYLPPSLL